MLLVSSYYLKQRQYTIVFPNKTLMNFNVNFASEQDILQVNKTRYKTNNTERI